MAVNLALVKCAESSMPAVYFSIKVSVLVQISLYYFFKDIFVLFNNAKYFRIFGLNLLLLLHVVLRPR